MIEPKLVKVLNIVGSGRSGSTLVANIVGQIPGVFSAGEMHALWQPGAIQQELCACGQPMTQCEIWQAIFTHAYGGLNKVDLNRVHHLYLHNARARYAIANMLQMPRHDRSEQAEYLDYLERLYLAIQGVTGCQVIIDTSKLPSYSYFLSLIPSLKSYSLHLVRDPRAVAYSWLRKKTWRTTQGNVEKTNSNIFQISREWNNQNVLAEFFGHNSQTKYMFMRYEDLVAEPEHRVREILDLVDLPDGISIVNGREVAVNTSHILGANPNRFDRGTIRINLDDAWKTSMPVRNRLWIELLTLPLMVKYQYSALHK